jgi:DNA-binding NtrC family response regulator
MEPSTAEEHSQAKRQKRILVVEEDFLTRWNVAEYLRETRFEVIEAVSGDEAKAILSARTAIDAMFSHINPSNPAHNAFLQWATEKHPGLPVLFTSGNTKAAALAEETPNRQFIAKPYTLAEIERLLNQLIVET